MMKKTNKLNSIVFIKSNFNPTAPPDGTALAPQGGALFFDDYES